MGFESDLLSVRSSTEPPFTIFLVFSVTKIPQQSRENQDCVYEYWTVIVERFKVFIKPCGLVFRFEKVVSCRSLLSWYVFIFFRYL